MPNVYTRDQFVVGAAGFTFSHVLSCLTSKCNYSLLDTTMSQCGRSLVLQDPNGGTNRSQIGKERLRLASLLMDLGKDKVPNENILYYLPGIFESRHLNSVLYRNSSEIINLFLMDFSIRSKSI